MKKIKRTIYAPTGNKPPQPIHNFVAKHAAAFTKSAVFKNPKKEYVRKPKHGQKFSEND